MQIFRRKILQVWVCEKKLYYDTSNRRTQCVIILFYYYILYLFCCYCAQCGTKSSFLRNEFLTRNESEHQLFDELSRQNISAQV